MILQRKSIDSNGILDLQRQPVEEEKKEEELLQAKEVAEHTPVGTPQVASGIASLRRGGQPLPASERTFFEPRFGHDFSHVRIHSDSQAAELARAVNARAFAVGKDVVFGTGEYAPGKVLGRRLLAHELTHVVQQSGDAPGTGQLRSLIHRQIGPRIQRQAYQNLTEVWLGRRPPLLDMSKFQSPGLSGWWGAKYGCYRNNCTRRHDGWDINAPIGTDVHATTMGSIRHNQDPGGYGDSIDLIPRGQLDLTFRYAHLSAREPANTVDGEPIVYGVGDRIGSVGTTGNAAAIRPHLHFEVIRGGAAIDPAAYFLEPFLVIEATGSSPTSIDRTANEPCAPC